MSQANWGPNVKFAFTAEWFDPESTLTRNFVLSWYPIDDTLELYDVKWRKMFLKRIKVKEVHLSDIYVGNSVTVFARQLKITGFANDYTRRLMAQTMQRVFAMIKPDAVKHKSKIIQTLVKGGFKVCNLKMFKVQKEQIEKLFEEKKDEDEKTGLEGGGVVVCMELVGEEGAARLESAVGPADPEEARGQAPASLRALYGTSLANNALYIATQPQLVERAVEALMRRPRLDEVTAMSTARLEDSTCCIVKPHAIREGHLGDILVSVEEAGYEITAMEMFYLDHITAGEFFEVYNGVLPEFPGMVQEFLTGACLVLEICGGPLPGQTATEFRKIVGPRDPEIARQLRPDTLRARFGVDKVQNGIHVPDLPEDAPLEVEYFFRIMQL